MVLFEDGCDFRNDCGADCCKLIMKSMPYLCVQVNLLMQHADLCMNIYTNTE